MSGISTPVVVFACVLLVMTAMPASGRAQFNLFPSNWNSGTERTLLYPPTVGESSDPPNSRCRTLLDINTHGSPDCPRDFEHQTFDTDQCRFVCLSDPTRMASLYDQNGVGAGDKPRSGLP